jgi:hypothetical protein
MGAALRDKVEALVHALALAPSSSSFVANGIGTQAKLGAQLAGDGGNRERCMHRGFFVGSFVGRDLRLRIRSRFWKRPKQRKTTD